MDPCKIQTGRCVNCQFTTGNKDSGVAGRGIRGIHANPVSFIGEAGTLRTKFQRVTGKHNQLTIAITGGASVLSEVKTMLRAELKNLVCTPTCDILVSK